MKEAIAILACGNPSNSDMTIIIMTKNPLLLGSLSLASRAGRGEMMQCTNG